LSLSQICYARGAKIAVSPLAIAVAAVIMTDLTKWAIIPPNRSSERSNEASIGNYFKVVKLFARV
jgi:hypothetical protein